LSESTSTRMGSGSRQDDLYVVVGFRVDEENSVYYRKCRGVEELKKCVEDAFTKKNADFISVRRIKK